MSLFVDLKNRNILEIQEVRYVSYGTLLLRKGTFSITCTPRNPLFYRFLLKVLKMKQLKLLWLLPVLLAVLFVLRPVPHPGKDSLMRRSGIPERIIETSHGDLIFRTTDGQRYYINRGVELGFRAADWSHYVGDTLYFHFPAYWTPLDPGGRNRHICVLENKQQEALFSDYD